MELRRIFLQILYLASLLMASVVQAENLQLITEELAPLSFTKDGYVTGFCTEVVREIMRRTSTHASIEVQPWMRGYKTAIEKVNVGLFCTSRTAEREELFQWVGPVSNIVDAVYARRGAGIKVKSLADAKGVESVLVLRGSYSHQLLEKLGFRNVYTGKTPEEIIKMILAGRAPLMVASNLTVPEVLSKLGERSDALEQVFIVARAQTYIAFSRGTSQTIVHRWQGALDDMKNDGSFSVIHTKWFPGEKEPEASPMPKWH